MRDSAMRANVPRQTIYYPPPGRPGWSCPPAEQLELLYLAWGWRKYGRTPQKQTVRDGWLYFTPRKGNPSLDLPDRQINLVPGEVVLLHPDCLGGWVDQPGKTADVCTWVWRSAPRWPSLHPQKEGFLRLRLAADAIQEIYALHELTRREIQHADSFTRVAIETLRDRLDLALVRSQSERPQPASDGQRLELACRWISQHLEDHNPVTGLCDYLQLSPSTLNRLFQRQLQLNVRAYAKEARLERAQYEIEQEGRSVKETAFNLGYHFPNDLSRAMSNWRRERGISTEKPAD